MKKNIRDIKSTCMESEHNQKCTRISETYKKKVGDVVFHISALSHHTAKQTASEMILQLLENKVLMESSE